MRLFNILLIREKQHWHDSLLFFLPGESFLSNISLDLSLYNQLIQQAFSCLSERKQTNPIIHTIYIVALKKIHQGKSYQMDMHWFGHGLCIKINKINKIVFSSVFLEWIFHFKKYFPTTECMPIADIFPIKLENFHHKYKRLEVLREITKQLRSLHFLGKSWKLVYHKTAIVRK